MPEVVWISRAAGSVGGRLAIDECPVSFVKAQSWAWIEEFVVYKRFGIGESVMNTPARTMDAFIILEDELAVLRRGDDA